jgi:hypothetical protein
MSTSYTINAKLGKPAVADTGWGPIITGDLDALDALAPVGGLAVTAHEQPSSSLNVDVAAGKYVKRDWTVGTYAGISGYTLPSGSVKALYLDATASYALTAGSTYPSTQHVRLTTVTTGASTVTSIVDDRVGPIVVGT